MTVYEIDSNITDARLRAIVNLLPPICQCFVVNPRWDGHDVNPPCVTVRLATTLLARLEKVWND